MRPCVGCSELLDDEAILCFACGRVQVDGDPPEVVDGRYVVQRELGRGAMGRVVLATDAALGRPVAVKLIAPEIAGDHREVARLQREAAALGRIRSPHVVQVYAFGARQNEVHFAMEYVEGASLEDVVRQHHEHDEHVPLVRVSTVVERIASGLDAAHAAGFVHRDVKPANVVVETGTGRPVLVDFGLVVTAQADADRTLHGTPAYMAPEQIRVGSDLGPVGPATDQYGLACTAYELLTGAPPFLASDFEELLRQHLDQPAPLVSTRRPRLTTVDRVLFRALSKRPADRYPSCGDFAAALADGILRIPGVAKLVSRPRIFHVPDYGGPTRQPSDPTALAEPSAQQKLSVAVLDDDPAFRKLIHRAAQLSLFRADVHVRSFATGTALLMAGDDSPDLLLLDQLLPDMKGVDVLGAIRARPDGARTRVLVVSGTAGEEARWRFSVLGVDRFVEKPVDLPQLVGAVTEVARRAGWRLPPRADSL